MYEYRAQVLRVVDGDTVHLEVDVGFSASIKMKIRLAGINAPELDTDAGKAARDYLSGLLPIGSNVFIRTLKDRQEKYGRYLAYIYADSMNGSVCFNNLLVENGHAVTYLNK